jgi:hypothetical protein
MSGEWRVKGARNRGASDRVMVVCRQKAPASPVAPGAGRRRRYSGIKQVTLRVDAA